MIKLLSTDFDGTLVDHYATPAVAPALFSALAELKARGCLWAVNTGRELYHIEEGLREFGFPVEPDYVLTAEREVFHRGPDGRWQDYGDWNARCMAAHHALFEQSLELLADIEGFMKEVPGAQLIHMGGRLIGLATSTDEDMDRVCDFLEKERLRVPGFHFMRNTVYVRFCHEDYSKGTALAELARLCGISREEVFAAGDHFNDIPMLDGTHARWVACPANAVLAVKQAVQKAGGYVARGECSRGVVEALRSFGALRDGAAKAPGKSRR
ncbi:MAG: HAD-IIB family hydrolase [Verrucomicrobiota bacterium]|nr:HAD-IIB family hydrolase [Verrucomicrobiota bacterium]